MGGRCPFSGQAGGTCPFSGSSSLGATPTPARASTVVHHRQDVDDVASAPIQVPMAGRILGSALQKKLDKLTEEDPDLCCPVSLMVLSNPVIASDGFIYDQSSLVQLLANHHVSPMT